MSHSTSALGNLAWRTASKCTGANCVEVADLTDGRVAMRDSKQTDGPILIFGRDEWQGFVDAARTGALNG
ncbi:DUF397 domain-containing protein [Streptosporangiaceae bacterium NEAU-GS5]|nr:DUF397 domain-containing protein [Streptosporangiaceae bacterium NEAU-GS5]